MSLADIAACNRRAIAASFIPPDEQRRVVDQYFA